jgi:hypothetical protein
MNRLAMLILTTSILGCSTPDVGHAQTPGPGPTAPGNTAPMTGIKPDRTVADPATRQKMRQKESVLRQKRAECRKEARDQKISILKRRSFIRDCMNR